MTRLLVGTILLTLSASASDLNTRWRKLPLGAVRADGWLQDQLRAQASGLTGHLDEFWGDIRDSAWKGKTGESWERTPYYLNGLVPLAFLLEDQRLVAKARPYIEYILGSAQPNGWFGPPQNKDPWPLALALKTLMSWYDGTQDARVLKLMSGYFRYLEREKPSWPAGTWTGMRAMEHGVAAMWYFRQTGDASVLDAVRRIEKDSFDWTSFFLAFPFDTAALNAGRIPKVREGYGMQAHGVNLAMALKYPALSYSLTGDSRALDAFASGLRSLREHHGQVGGRFSGDDHLCGRSPARGTELCLVVDHMFSLEVAAEILGGSYTKSDGSEQRIGDALELLAYNALPGTITADCWAHQYNQQSNQVLVSRASRPWTSTGPGSNLYGLMPSYPSCLVNMHQGWPMFVQHLWMATPDGGLAAVAYAPSRITTRINGARVTITQQTEYPFDSTITLRIDADRPARFPLHLRIPAWADGAIVQAKGRTLQPKSGSALVLAERWSRGDTVRIHLPMRVRTERRFNDSVALLRGPLYFALRVAGDYRRIHYKDKYTESIDYLGSADWEIYPRSAWNYALDVDPASPEASVSIKRNRIARLPFADRGEMVYAPERDKHEAWSGDAPVIIRAKARRLRQWSLKDNSADDPPRSPVTSTEPAEEVELVPYGCTRLRISEFPFIRRSPS